MDTDESYLRPCKQLPSPVHDRQGLSSSMGQYLAVQSCQGQLEQASHESSSEPCGALDDNQEDDSSLSDTESGVEAAEQIVGKKTEEKVARLLKGKEKDWAAAARKTGALRLLDLPLDILRIIFKEVTHTNDLANCAKVSSALHSVVTPMIYSRFDIVWPDTLSSNEPRAGVDALTYGLATLVMREDLFENAQCPDSSACAPICQDFACAHCGLVNFINPTMLTQKSHRKSRRGNFFSQFVKKFSLGNGPPDWVQEYLVTKESGKMLGTLVALSLARMPNLESFVWDMPTGILRDIWIALSSLGDRRPSKLEKMWIRFHDNQAALHDAGLTSSVVTSQPPQATAGVPNTVQSSQQEDLSNPQRYGVNKVEWIDHQLETPNFSIMPSLRSLTVLEIDEVRYLVELSVLLRRSLGTLRELRLGMAPTLYVPPATRDEIDVAPLFDGGVWALLMSKIVRRPKDGVVASSASDGEAQTHEVASTSVSAEMNAELSDNMPNHSGPIGNGDPRELVQTTSFEPNVPDIPPSNSVGRENANMSLEAIDPALCDQSTDFKVAGDHPESGLAASPCSDQLARAQLPEALESLKINTVDTITHDNGSVPTNRLRLEVLEIERLTRLNQLVLSKTIDFTVMTSLTLLRCGDQSTLWDRLRREFAPRKTRVIPSTDQALKHISHKPSVRRSKKEMELALDDMDYQLRVKRIHTDAVSSDLISFLKLTLAPNTLEHMFLQDNEKSPSSVTLEAIYRGPLRRHRGSLIKVLVDSTYGPSSSRLRSGTSLKWMLNRDVLTFITSGKMSKLRELAIAVEYKDWHFFLQRLPNVPHLRSLYIPWISNHPYGSSLNVKDFALGAIDVVALRPEVELCYLGIKNKCFEILETKQKDVSSRGPGVPSPGDDSDDDTQDEDHNDEEEDSDDGGAAPPAPAVEQGAMDSDIGSITSDDDSDGQDHSVKKKRLKLREILFYDDKISIFKARHGRL